MRSSVRAMADGLYDLTERKYRVWEYRRMARRRLRAMGGGADCRAAYRRTVAPYWARFGVRPGLLWYRLFAAADGTVDPRYIPDDLWFDRILPYYSNPQFRRFGEDKNYHAVWLPEVRRPATVACRIAGVYYDGDYHIITREQAAERCLTFGDLLLKPSVDSGEGHDIRFIRHGELDRSAMLAALDGAGGNFLAQEAVMQHETLARLHPDSVNTLRIISFLFENEVHILSAILRVGGNGARVDNVGAGGSACPVGPDGRLGRFSVNRQSQRSEYAPNGARWDTVTVPGYEKALAIIRAHHGKLAHFKLIGWDFAIDPAGEPVMIEFNTAPGQNQFCCGPTFGDLTDRVLTDVFLTKSLKGSQN